MQTYNFVKSEPKQNKVGPATTAKKLFAYWMQSWEKIMEMLLEKLQKKHADNKQIHSPKL